MKVFILFLYIYSIQLSIPSVIIRYMWWYNCTWIYVVQRWRGSEPQLPLVLFIDQRLRATPQHKWWLQFWTSPTLQQYPLGAGQVMHRLLFELLARHRSWKSGVNWIDYVMHFKLNHHISTLWIGMGKRKGMELVKCIR